MFRKIGSLLITLLGLALLVYSAARSLDFISLTLPDDRKILAYFGLAALDGGLVAWLLAYLYGSRGWQRAMIALLMILVDLLGAVAMFTADTLLNAGRAGLGAGLAPETTNAAIMALSGIIAINIAATIAHHLTDPDKLREMAEEEAFDHLDDEELKAIKTNATTLAAEVAPIRALAWQERQRARYLGLSGMDPTVLWTCRRSPQGLRLITSRASYGHSKKSRTSPLPLTPNWSRQSWQPLLSSKTARFNQAVMATR